MAMALFVALAALSWQQVAPTPSAACEVQPGSVIGRSSGGVAQVSNLSLIQLQASIRRRPIPASGTLEGLRAGAVVYQLLPNGGKQLVPASVTVSGGGGDPRSEQVSFFLDIPIDPSARDAAIERYLAELKPPPTFPADVQKRGLAGIFRQHRVGRFQVECRVRDGLAPLGTGRVDIEVVSKGNFFDQEAFRKR